MASLDNIYKALRLLHEFDGNPNVLTRFIKLCEEIVERYGQDIDELEKVSLENGILNKIVGPAARLINTNGIPTDWAGIRSALVNNFSDQRDETALYNDLALLTQGSSTPQEFYERCQNLFSTIMTYISLHDNLESTIAAKRDLYKKLTLQAYLRGLKDPLGSRIRCMRPETIEKALEFVHEEMNTIYMQSRNDHLPDRKMLGQMLSNQLTPNFKMPNHTITHMQHPPKSYYNVVMPGPSRPQHGIKPPPFQPRMQTRTQQMFAAPPPGYNQRNPVFKMPPQPVNHGPKPMSGVSHFMPKQLPPTPWNWARQGNPPPSNYFKTRDVNLNECSNYDDSSYHTYDAYYDPYYCNEYDEFNYNDYYSSYETPYNSEMFSQTEQQVVEEKIPQPSAEDFQKDQKSDKLG